MKRAWRAGSMWLVLAGALMQMHGAGLIVVHDSEFWRHPPEILPVPPYPPPHPPTPPPRPFPPRRIVPPPAPAWAPLEVAFTRVEADIKDQIATTRVEQEFYNPNPRQLEGTFLFPVPKGAHLDRFTMEIDGHPVEAELLAADKARGIYEDIVRKLRDPALLEYCGRDLFKVRIFPIEPQSRKRITLAYSQLLKADAGLVQFAFPLNTEKFSSKPIPNLRVKVTLDSTQPLQAIYSPSHKVDIRREGARHAVIGLEERQARPDTDFQLLFSREAREVGLSLLAHKAAGDEGYFLLLASPSAETRARRVVPKDVAFVLDTSGSMAGPKLEQARKALAFCVENLNAEDRFEILRFSTEVEPLFNGLSEATAEHRSRAQRFVGELKPIGGTAIHEALTQALRLRREAGGRPFVVIFLTDGLPTVGPTDEATIVGGITRDRSASTRVFCFGIGTDVNTHLLDRITEETRAFSTYVLPDEDLELKLSSFFTRIKEPVLSGPGLTFPAGIRTAKLYPSPLPDLYRGEQLVVVGRYSGQGGGALQIEGRVDGELQRFAEDVRFPEAARDHEFIPRLWATRRVGHLLDEIRLRGESQELKDEVSDLARRYNIVTPYTAYLILEDEGRRDVAEDLRSFRMSDAEQRRELSGGYGAFLNDRSGGLAVGSARSARELKSANAPADAIASGRLEGVQSLARAAAPSASAYGSSDRSIAGRSGGATVEKPLGEEVEKRVSAYAQPSRYIQGRTFYYNGEQWIDTEVQKATTARRVRLSFASPEYFELLKRHPEAQGWMSVGANLQLLLDQTVYEVSVAEPVR